MLAAGITIAGCILILALVYFCRSSQSVTSDDSTAVADVDILGNSIATKGFSKESPSKYSENNVIDYEYPISGNSSLLRNIREWLNEQLGGTYEGNLNDADAMFKHYSEILGKDEDIQTTTVIKKFYENDIIVTFNHEGSYYAGGAHGIETMFGTTFRKSDGKIFTKDMIVAPYLIQNYVRSGLKKYFELTTDEELMYRLNVDTTLYIPLPKSNPWITEKEVIFCYRPYENGLSFSDGSPFFTIPVTEMVKYLTTTGKTFIDLTIPEQDKSDSVYNNDYVEIM